MKNATRILLTFLLLPGLRVSGQELRTDPTVNSIFTSREISNLEKILNFFAQQICTSGEIDDHQEISCYTSYCRNLKERTSAFSSVDLKLSLAAQREFYNRLDTSTFNEIWHHEKSWNTKTGDTITRINLDPEGNYAKFLEALGHEYSQVGEYYDDLESMGGICPTQLAQLLMNYREFNFTDERIRLLFAIHYLTMNEQFSGKKEN